MSTAAVLTSTMDMSREDWLESRRQGIGGSDSPVILLGDKHPFTSPLELWEEKRGLSGGAKETPAMKRGQVMEGLIAKLYSEETGRKVRRVNAILQHPEHPWMLANVDREIVAARPEDGPGILEIKCPGQWVFSKCKYEGIPNYYQIQMQHYLGVTGRKWGAFAVFNAEKWEMIQFDINRNDELISKIVDADYKFWRMVEEGIPPEEAEQPVVNLPPVPVDSKMIHLDTDGWKAAVEGLMEAKEILAQAKELEDSAKARIANIMDFYGVEVAEGFGLRVYYREQEGKRTFDHKALKRAHPELDLEPYFKTGKRIKPLNPKPLKEARPHE